MSSISLWRWGSLPAEHRGNFIHLYLDIAWFGLLNGSAISFAAIYATRLGANSLQIGLLSASPAIISLIFTLPAGQWLQALNALAGEDLAALLLQPAGSGFGKEGA